MPRSEEAYFGPGGGEGREEEGEEDGGWGGGSISNISETRHD